MEIISLLVFTIALSITPGPNNIMLMSSGVNHGIRASMPHYLGVEVGFPAMLIMVGLGAENIFLLFPNFQSILKILGSIYLIYLAWGIATTPVAAKEIHNKKPISFIQALLFQWVNPKAWIMVISAMATFPVPSEPFFNQVLQITLMFILVGMPCGGVWLLLGNSLRSLLLKPEKLLWFNRIMGFLLVLSLAPGWIETL